MYTVKFSNGCGSVRDIGISKDKDGCFKIINEFLGEHNYTSYYMRVWDTEFQGEPATKVDVGSWSEFFYLVREENK